MPTLVIIHKTIFIVMSYMAQSHMREFTLGTMSESRSAPGGHQPAGQLQTWTFESVLYYYSTMRFMLFTSSWRMERWVDHRHCSKCAAMPKCAYIAAILWKTQKLVRSLGSIMTPLTLQASMLPLNHCNMWLWLISNWSVAPTELFWKPKCMSSHC